MKITYFTADTNLKIVTFKLKKVMIVSFKTIFASFKNAFLLTMPQCAATRHEQFIAIIVSLPENTFLLSKAIIG